jgi:hypothetical protein
MNLIKFCVIVILLAPQISVAEAVKSETKNPVTDKTFACNGLLAERLELESSLGHSVKQEFLDEKVLVEFGSLLAYMTPQQSVAYYSERIRHIKSLETILMCAKPQ